MRCITTPEVRAGQIRRPKAETRGKPESRRPKREWLGRGRCSQGLLSVGEVLPAGVRVPV